MDSCPEFASDVEFSRIARDEVLSALSFTGMTCEQAYNAVECLTFQTVEQTLRELVASGDVRKLRGELFALAPTPVRRGGAHVVRPMNWRQTEAMS